MENLNIALLQMDLVWENPKENRAAAENLIETIAVNPDVIVLPEMFTTGFSMQPKGLAEPHLGETYDWMQSIAQKTGACIAGSLIIEDNGQFFNRMYIVHPPGLLAQYDKRHLFRMAGEDAAYGQGTTNQIFEVKGWRILPQICYDLRFPVWSRNQLKAGKGGYDLALYVANWPERRASHWELLLRARAVENQAFVAGVNRVGVDGNQITYTGDSAIIDPLGKAIVTASGQPRVLEAELKADALVAYREKFPAWKDADYFSLEG